MGVLLRYCSDSCISYIVFSIIHHGFFFCDYCDAGVVVGDNVMFTMMLTTAVVVAKFVGTDDSIFICYTAILNS